MAFPATNNFGALLPIQIATGAAEYLSTRMAFLKKGRIRVENFFESDLNAGGNQIRLPRPPTGGIAPQQVTPGNTQAFASSTNLTVNYSLLDFTVAVNHIGHQITANQLEDRYAKGGWKYVIELELGALLDGIATQIDNSIASLVPAVALQTGTPGVAITDTTVRTAINMLAQKPYNVKLTPDRVTAMWSNNVYWNQLFNINNYTLVLNRGLSTNAIDTGELRDIYGAAFDWSSNVYAANNSSGQFTTYNCIYDRDAFVIGFMRFNPADKYASGAGAQVEEAQFEDPETGINLRVMKYFQPQSKIWVYELDVKYAVQIYDPNRAIMVLS